MSTSQAVTMSAEKLSAWKKSQRETLNNFCDGATEIISKKIVDFEREGKRQQEVHEAKFSARMSELSYRLESVADLERRLAERLTTLKDSRVGLTVQDVEPVLRELVSDAMSKQPVPKDGRSVTLDDVRPLIAEQVAEALARMREDQPAARDVRHWTPRPTGWPHNMPDIIDVDVDVEDNPHPVRIEHVTAAVKLLQIANKPNQERQR